MQGSGATEPLRVVTTDEDGSEHAFEVIDVVSVEGQLYGLMAYFGAEGSDGDPDVVVMRIIEDADGEQSFEAIDDSAEFDRVVAVAMGDGVDVEDASDCEGGFAVQAPEAAARPADSTALPPWLTPTDPADWPTWLLDDPQLRSRIPVREGWAPTGLALWTGKAWRRVLRGYYPTDWLVMETLEAANPATDLTDWVRAPLALTGFPVEAMLEAAPQLLDFDDVDCPGLAAALSVDEAYAFTGTASIPDQWGRAGRARLYVVLARRGVVAWQVALSLLSACPHGVGEEHGMCVDHDRAGATLGCLVFAPVVAGLSDSDVRRDRLRARVSAAGERAVDGAVEFVEEDGSRSPGWLAVTPQSLFWSRPEREAVLTYPAAQVRKVGERADGTIELHLEFPDGRMGWLCFRSERTGPVEALRLLVSPGPQTLAGAFNLADLLHADLPLASWPGCPFCAVVTSDPTLTQGQNSAECLRCRRFFAGPGVWLQVHSRDETGSLWTEQPYPDLPQQWDRDRSRFIRPWGFIRDETGQTYFIPDLAAERVAVAVVEARTAGAPPARGEGV